MVQFKSYNCFSPNSINFVLLMSKKLNSLYTANASGDLRGFTGVLCVPGFFVEKLGDFISSKEMFNEPRNFRATLLTVHLQPVVAVVRSNHPYPLILTKVRM